MSDEDIQQVPPYELMGGKQGLDDLVDRFYDAMDTLPRARTIRAMHGPETLSVRLFSSWLMHNSTQNRGALVDERSGAIGGASLPKRKATMSVTYGNGPWSLFVQGRFIDGGKLDRTLAESTTAYVAANYAGTLITGTIDDNRVASVFYVDTNVSYKIESLGNLSVFANVSNLLDHQPASAPTAIGRTGPSEYNSALHDVIGRRYVVGLNYKF